MSTVQPMFEVVAFFQYMENYGDSLKPWWKMKGGEEITLMDGITLEMMPHIGDLQFIVRHLIAAHEWDNSHSRQYCVGVEVALKRRWTRDDEWKAHDWFGEWDFDAEALNMGLVEADDSLPPETEKYISMAEAAGYGNQ